MLWVRFWLGVSRHFLTTTRMEEIRAICGRAVVVEATASVRAPVGSQAAALLFRLEERNAAVRRRARREDRKVREQETPVCRSKSV